MQILFRYFSIRLGIEKVPMPFSKRLLKISKVPAIKTGTRLTLQRKKQHKFSSFSRQTFNCYTPTHLFYKLMDNRKTKTAAFFRASFITLIKPFKYVFQIFFLNSHSYNNNYGLRRGSQPRLFPSQSRSC